MSFWSIGESVRCIVKSDRCYFGGTARNFENWDVHIESVIQTATAPIATVESHASSVNISSANKRLNVLHRVQYRRGRNRKEKAIMAHMMGWL